MYFDGKKWSTKYSAEIAQDGVDVKAKVDHMQALTISAKDPPPFYDLDAPKSRVERKRKRKNGKSSEGSGSGGRAVAGIHWQVMMVSTRKEVQT